MSIGVLLCALLAAEAEGQTVHRGTDVGSVQPWRGYFSPQGLDHFDTKTGNLVLTVADLTLPGNHVHDLVVRRTYNNDTVQPPASYGVAGWRWSVGLDGLVMRVLEKSWPTNTPISTLEQEINNTPIFVMGDGSLKRTRYFYQYVASTGTAGQNSQRWVVSAGFFKYNRSERKLWMPDGRVCQYDSQRRLTSCTDAFGNSISLSYSSSQITVTQALGGGQSRQLVLERNANGDILALVYAGRRWDYLRNGHDIVEVQSPVGLEWQFTYDQGTLASVTTPGGGIISYGYTNQSYGFGTIRVLSSRTTSGPNGGTWTFSLQPGYSATERLAPVTEIQTPSGATLRWENFSGSAGTLVMGGGTGFLTQSLLNGSGQWVQKEERQYVSLDMVSHAWEGPAQISQQVIRERDPVTSHERSRTITYGYPPGYFMFYGYHFPNVITEVSSDGTSRQTNLSHWHYEGPPAYPSQRFSIGLKISESATVNGQPVGLQTWGFSETWRHPGNTLVNGSPRIRPPRAATCRRSRIPTRTRRRSAIPGAW